MRIASFAICLGSLHVLGGCVAAEGVNMYHLRGRLGDLHSGQPVAGARIVGAIFLDHDPPKEHWERAFCLTNENGEFDVPVGRLCGGLYPLFLIPDSHTPDELQEVAVYVGREGKWQRMVLPLSPSQQSHVTGNDRWVELGELKYDPNAPTVTTHPAGS